MKILQAIQRWAASMTDAWNHFWFDAADPATLGLIRILAGAMLLYTHLVWSFALDAFFGSKGWVSPTAVNAMQERPLSWSHWNWIHSSGVIWTAHIAALVVFLMFMLGLYTRVTSIAAYLLTVSYANRVPGALFGLDDLNMMLALYLAIGPSGAAYSLDNWLRARKAAHSLDKKAKLEPPPGPSTRANVAIRLMQIHLCIIYLFSGMGKLQGEAWWDGTAIWGAVANQEYQSLDLTWLARWPLTVNLLTHVTVFWELFYCALIWPRLTRPLVLLVAIPIHLGIACCLGMMTFGLVMLIANLAFVAPSLTRAIMEWLPHPHALSRDRVAVAGAE